MRELGVYCEIHPYTLDVHYFNQLQPSGIILSGGPASVAAPNAPRIPEWVFKTKLPILGICYGMQTLALQLGGEVARSKSSEYGHAELFVLTSSVLFEQVAKVNESTNVWMSHGDHVSSLPLGFSAIGATNNIDYAAIADEERAWYGVQFHPEVTHTQHGLKIIVNFIFKICKIKPSWTTEFILEHTIASIKHNVSPTFTFCPTLTSGGFPGAVHR